MITNLEKRQVKRFIRTVFKISKKKIFNSKVEKLWKNFSSVYMLVKQKSIQEAK